ncbi:pentapeptide repeat-containing protein [Arthrobacter alpinus]|uniref:pentapeptide repeat-containing protein n=1 Tax=Arthrobacter alpinus TaxID=656366 RepID=UPI00164968CC|nr:pentapeptide repeat-containing protein [Arthrobacter alpinus]
MTLKVGWDATIDICKVAAVSTCSARFGTVAGGNAIEDFIASPVAAGITVTGTISAFALIWAILSADELVGTQRKRFRTLPLMILVAATISTIFLAFYAAAFGATEFLNTASTSPSLGTSSNLRVAPITVAAGLFGGVLFIAFTVLKYRGHTQADERLVLEQRGAALQISEHFSERFAKSAEMLGSDRAATRMGGVYALAALADVWVENRQQCVDLLCGYLRTPMKMGGKTEAGVAGDYPKVDLPTPPSAPAELLPRPQRSPHVDPSIISSYRALRADAAAKCRGGARTDELAVRKAIITSIARGVRRPKDDPASWSAMEFDLSRSFVQDLDFSDCRFVQRVNFNGTIFDGATNMRDTYFSQNAQFDGCMFMGNVWFSGAFFAGHAWFRATEFAGTAAFGRVAFQGGMLFNFAHFQVPPHLRNNQLGRVGSEELSDIPIANLGGVSYGGDLTACPDANSGSLWDTFEYVQRGYTIICERDHADRHFDSKFANLMS